MVFATQRARSEVPLRPDSILRGQPPGSARADVYGADCREESPLLPPETPSAAVSHWTTHWRRGLLRSICVQGSFRPGYRGAIECCTLGAGHPGIASRSRADRAPVAVFPGPILPLRGPLLRVGRGWRVRWADQPSAARARGAPPAAEGEACLMAAPTAPQNPPFCRKITCWPPPSPRSRSTA